MVTAKKIDHSINHPEPDTSANEAQDGQPPATWNPNGKSEIRQEESPWAP